MSKFFCWFVKLTSWIPYLIFMRPKIYYVNKSIQKRKIKNKAILVCNHNSIMDFAAMMFTFPFRNLRCLAAEVLYERGKFMRFFLNKMGCIKVNRFNKDFSFIDTSSRLLNNNKVVEIFPESRIPNKNENKPLPFKPSAAYLSYISNTRIIPVVTNGCYFQRKRLKILIGTPIHFDELVKDEKSEKEKIELINKKLEEIIKNMYYEIKSK